MSSLQDQPLSALAQSLMETDAVPMKSAASDHSAHADHGHGSAHGCWAFVFYFLVLALFFYFVYFALRPSFVLKKDCDDSRSYGSYSDESRDEIDNSRLLGAAVVTALVLIFVFWLLSWLSHGSW